MKNNDYSIRGVKTMENEHMNTRKGSKKTGKVF